MVYRIYLVGAVLIFMSLMSHAGQPDRPMIRLSCPANIAGHEQLCQAMVQAIAEAAPAITVQNVPRGEETPVRAGEMAVALVVSGISTGGMTGRFDWQVGKGPLRKGPDIQFSVMDTTLSPKMYDRFARSLIRESDGLRAAIATLLPD